MRKVNALIRYEIINLRRNVLPWIIIILYSFGVQQVISNEKQFLSLVNFIECSWLPLNFIMIPLLFLGLNIGKSNNDIFNTIDISPKEKVLSNVLTMAVIDAFIFVITMIPVIMLGIMCKVSFGYFFYQILGYAVNTVIFLIGVSAIGLFIGHVIAINIADVVAFLTAIIAFIVLCNFYKPSIFIIPIIFIRQITNNFDVISYDKIYLFHNILWLLISFILLRITFFKEYNTVKKSKAIVQRVTFILACIVCAYLIVNIRLLTPEFYNSGKNMYQPIESEGIEKWDSFRSKKEELYCVYKYNMNIEIDDKLKNNCDMEIKILQDNVDSMEFGLYGKLNVSRLELDSKKLNFKRTKNSIKFDLPRQYNNGEILHIRINYDGNINTVWIQKNPLYFVRNNALCLAGVFEWYPKQNDGRLKNYSIDIKYNSKNKLYSNLDGDNKIGHANLQGDDKEIVLVSGNIIERKYKDHLFIGNEEYVNNDKECDSLLKIIPQITATKTRKVIQIPESYYNEKGYEKAFLFTR